jgi:hypothetical protein
MAIFLPMILSISLVFILPFTSAKFRARLSRDPLEAIMFGIAAVLAFALLVSAAMVMRTHNIAPVKITLLAAGVFAVVGIGFGLFRSLRGKHAA